MQPFQALQYQAVVDGLWHEKNARFEELEMGIVNFYKRGLNPFAPPCGARSANVSAPTASCKRAVKEGA